MGGKAGINICMWTVYKITNDINQKTYIGVHKTDNPNDSYMGSGTAIRNAIKKHGKDHFTKEVVFVTDSKDAAFAKEKELTVDFFKEANYNMKLGGVGGFTKDDALRGRAAVEQLYGSTELGKIGGRASVEQKKGYHSLSKEELSNNGRKGGLKNKGKPKSEEFKQRLREIWIAKKQKGT
jgi:GIY-YIG catalytic domain